VQASANFLKTVNGGMVQHGAMIEAPPALCHDPGAVASHNLFYGMYLLRDLNLQQVTMTIDLSFMRIIAETAGQPEKAAKFLR
jgi:hypothetical protein